MMPQEWISYNHRGSRRIIVTKNLPGEQWKRILIEAGCRVDLCTSSEILTETELVSAMEGHCDGAIGQLTEKWSKRCFSALRSAGGKVYCNYAVGFNNVDTVAATVYGIAVGNTPGVLTETTAEMAVALTFAAARRVIEGDRFVREGRFTGWLPTLFLGQLLNHKTLGVIGTGRIGEAYARMMVGGFCMNLVYYDLHENKSLENFVASFSMLQREMGNPGISVKRAETIDELLAASDVISLHTTLNESTYHLINAERLSLMKDSAILINVSRGNVVDEKMLVLHCSTHPEFRVGLDVYENEPVLSTGLSELPNVVLAPHLGSATMWTRTNMAMLSAHNIAAILNGYPVWNQQDISPFLADLAPKAAPSIVNAHELGLPLYLAH